MKLFINIITQYSPRPLPYNIYMAYTKNRMTEKTLLPLSP
jgi:hypothetical protein